MCCVHTSSAGGDIYFTCHLTRQDHSVEILCIYIYIYIYIDTYMHMDIYIYMHMLIYAYIYIHTYNIYILYIWYCGKKTMQNNFTWYLKFHAGGLTIFSQVQRSLKIYSIMISLIWRHLCSVHFQRFRSLTSASGYYLPQSD